MAEAKKTTAKSKEQRAESNEEEIITTHSSELIAQEPKTTAKAGKRSTKALTEAKLLEEKQQRKAESENGLDDKPKQAVKPSKSRLERRSKNFRKVAQLIEVGKFYSVKDALELAVQTSPVKFDATVELHVRLGVDPRQADQNIRDTIVLPAGTGKTVRIAVYADVDDAVAAKKAGADIAGNEEFLQQLDKGLLDFDILISTPAGMPKLSKYARVLGPKGLMPNPKSGTVTTDIAKAVKEAKAGRVEYRVDSTGIVHVGVGKVSFGSEKLVENTKALLTSLKSNKPASIKGNYVRSIYVTTAMGPSISVLTSEL